MTVYFSTDEYEQAHGRRPRGYGSWAFCPREYYRGNDYLEHTKWFNGCTYGEAKRQARAAFAAVGVDEVEVCS